MNFYLFRPLPFGLGCAPFIFQTFLIAIVKYILKSTPYVWGHIDDLLIAHKSTGTFSQLVRKFETLGKVFRSWMAVCSKK